MGNNGFGIGGALLAGLLIAGTAGTASAGVNVGVNINLGPPPIMAAAPPEVVLVPNTQVYFVPGAPADVFFYNGFWWSPRGERWYRARGYSGPWRVVERRAVPGPLFRVPRDYRTAYVRERRIPYGEWRDRHAREEHREAREERHERRAEFREREGEGRREHGGGHER